MENNHISTAALLAVLMGVIICFLIGFLIGNSSYSDIEHITTESDRLREMDFSKTDIDYIYTKAEEWDMDAYDLLSVVYIYDIPFNEKSNISYKDIYKKYIFITRVYPKVFNDTKNVFVSLLSDIKYFPVPYSKDRREWVNYVDSWGFDRTYGGKRTHEGTDIMADVNESGLYPVISATSGVVENIGWLERGGWRVGIRSEHGGYYYYAHLAEYADIKKGDYVSAGQLLGFMGNTGYGVKEGTSGMFDVHLHFGVYIQNGDNEISYNPYWILKYLEKNILIYSY